MLKELIEKHFDDYEIVKKDDWKALHNKIPNGWQLILMQTKEERIKVALDLWDPFFKRLPNFERVMRKYLAEVTIIKSSGKLCMIYYFASNDDKFIYIGNPPLKKEKRHIVSHFPKLFGDFYKYMHNGFYIYPFKYFGPISSDDFFTLNSYDWDFLNQESVSHSQPLINLENYLVVFANGTGGYLCLDISKRQSDNCYGLIWWNDEPPDQERFWPALDAWMEIGISDT